MLRAEHLHVTLARDGGTVRAVHDVHLALARGETVALVGESGCGKSMTALAVVQLLPENGAIAAGRVTLDGLDLTAMPAGLLRTVRGRRIGMVFQDPGASLNPVVSIGQQMLEAIEAHTALRGAQAWQRAVEWLEQVQLPDARTRMHSHPFQLSGGQKQRVMIAMMLASEPDFLIADEPTTALDVLVQQEVLDLLRRLQAERRLGLLLITHDLGVVAGMAHRVMLMYAGQVVEVAPTAAFFSNAQHPYGRLLLRARPHASLRGQPLAAIEGRVPALDADFDACRFAPRCPVATAACHIGEPPLRPVAEHHEVRCVHPAALGLHAPAAVAVVSQQAHPARAEAGTVLSVRDLSVSHHRPARQPHRVVDTVSLELRAGETLALVGPSGCGKTTLGRALMRLLGRRAQVQGRVTLDGLNWLALPDRLARRGRGRMQMVFQDPAASLDPRMRVVESLDEGLRALTRLDWRQRRDRVHAWAARVGLDPSVLQRYPHQLSGGQRQRVAIARALAVEPRVLICDEPTSSLDASVQAQVLNLLNELQRSTGVAILLITHDMGVVGYLADRVAVMHDGQIVEAGGVKTVLENPRSNVTRNLLDAMPHWPGHDGSLR